MEMEDNADPKEYVGGAEEAMRECVEYLNSMLKIKVPYEMFTSRWNGVMAFEEENNKDS